MRRQKHFETLDRQPVRVVSKIFGEINWAFLVGQTGEIS